MKPIKKIDILIDIGAMQSMMPALTYTNCRNLQDMYQHMFDAWFAKTVEPINKLLAEGRVVYNNKNNDIGYIQAFHSTGDVTHMGFTHEAYLIGEKEIKKETAADVLRDLVDFMVKHNSAFLKSEQYNKAIRVLEDSECD